MGSHSPQRHPSILQRRLGAALPALRRGARDASGFTLIEILVVILIIGILAAIAIPSFLSQANKAEDAQAKSLVRTAQTEATAIAAENNGGYEQVTPEELNKHEPSIGITPTTKQAYLSGAEGGRSEYKLTAKATDGDEYTISLSPTGDIARRCVSTVSKTGCAGGEEASW